MYFDFLHKLCLKRFSLLEELSEIQPRMYKVLHVKYLLFLSDFNERVQEKVAATRTEDGYK